MYTAPRLFKNLDIRPRLLIAVGGAVFVSALLLPSGLHLPTRILCGWNFGVYSFLALALWKMLRARPEKMHRYSLSDYQGRFALLLLVAGSACASVLAIRFLLADTKGLAMPMLTLHIWLSITTIIASWLLVHTIFALEYAHSYYHDSIGSKKHVPCLDFRAEREPDYWEFLYFSFVIGMTSQVSDIQTASRHTRRLALLHGIVSFFFNTSILAMSINIIAALI